MGNIININRNRRIFVLSITLIIIAEIGAITFYLNATFSIALVILLILLAIAFAIIWLSLFSIIASFVFLYKANILMRKKEKIYFIRLVKESYIKVFEFVFI